VPNAPRQQNWSVLYRVHGLRQTLPLVSPAGQLVFTASLQELGPVQLVFDVVTVMVLSIAST
jgi:hypothetical protein